MPSDPVPLHVEEAGDDGVLEEVPVLLGLRHVPQRLRLRQGHLLGLRGSPARVQPLVLDVVGDGVRGDGGRRLRLRVDGQILPECKGRSDTACSLHSSITYLVLIFTCLSSR